MACYFIINLQIQNEKGKKKKTNKKPFPFFQSHAQVKNKQLENGSNVQVSFEHFVYFFDWL